MQGGKKETRDALEELRTKYCQERGDEKGKKKLRNNTHDEEEDNFLLLPLKEQYSHHHPIFLQAVQEVATSLKPLFGDKEMGDIYKRAFLVMVEPERSISFRVLWTDDIGHLRSNVGWRIEFSSALGPFKGGLRFHPTVDEGVLKFLGFEQTFKNALTGLNMGGGKGGSNFDPKGKSDSEIRRFCQAFMTHLNKYIDPSTDIPAGDIGVGETEVGFMFGQYKQLSNRHRDGGVLTGKPVSVMGSELRPEATGFGLVYVAKFAIEEMGGTLQNARCVVSGSGNVAQYTVRKLIDVGAKVVTMSDSNGCIVFKNGMTEADWKVAIEAKQVKKARLSSLVVTRMNGEYLDNISPWSISDLEVDYAFPCATENEIDDQAMKQLIRHGLKGIFEGANLPITLEGQRVIHEHKKILYIPGKVANAGGVVVSQFEMAQNAQLVHWSSDELDKKLQSTMKSMYSQVKSVSDEKGCSLEDAANRVAFLKIFKAMKDLGWVW